MPSPFSIARSIRGPIGGWILCSFLAVFLVLGGSGCAEDNDDATGPGEVTSKTDDCKGCHTSKEKLVATADPPPPPPEEEPGEG
ncbi:MAG: hypothetical protein GF346_11665 [Candidatus Eisenbacteria bacterium]|nr:hypothetical protein [Candidatus Latescibacterota bacterium]MBD3303094.1 hypothetical protein [Candidatus Eisenbacteria bacterium]